MKILFTYLLMLAVSLSLIVCNDGKKPSTSLVTSAADTTRPIDTVIEEPGVAPLVAEDPTARKTDKDKPEKQKKIKISCTMGQQKFNKNKRPIQEAPGGVKGKPPKPPKPGQPPTEPPPDPPPSTGDNVIFINYFGATISGTMWNTNGDFTVGDAGLAQAEMDYIKGQVLRHFPEYNVKITYDKAVFDLVPEGKKIEVIVTEDWQWYGQAGGVAYINSFFWTTPEPAFVFSLLLNYNGHNIAEAIAHEAMHTLGLRHQSVCDANGVVINQYRPGWTMGVSYYVDLGIEGTGTSSMQCAIQDDKAKLLSALGSRQFAYLKN